jgi:predicted glycosyltransferase
MTNYSYIIIKENYPALERESVLLENNYLPRKKYAYINKVVNRDGSENIAFINYSNDLQDLQNRAKGFVSWYNYPLGVAKDMQGYLREI